MQWPDATASSGTAGFEASAGFQAGTGLEASTGFQASTGLEASAGFQVGGTAVDAGLAMSALATASGVPGGLDLPCTDDPELFFAEAPEHVEQAKDLCQGCRARLSCLAGALERREPWGVWGGELVIRGTIVPRKRPRGRPRKTETGISKAGERAA